MMAYFCVRGTLTIKHTCEPVAYCATKVLLPLHMVEKVDVNSVYYFNLVSLNGD